MDKEEHTTDAADERPYEDIPTLVDIRGYEVYGATWAERFLAVILGSDRVACYFHWKISKKMARIRQCKKVEAKRLLCGR